mgnify:CR=1 FL=1
MGQSNIAAGATLGSNHNSRGADGEVIMGRGFWPGLCVSIKHNSIFPSFTILNKSLTPTQGDDLTLNLKLTGDELPAEIYVEDGKNTYKLEKESINKFNYSIKNIQNDKKLIFNQLEQLVHFFYSKRPPQYFER